MPLFLTYRLKIERVDSFRTPESAGADPRDAVTISSTSWDLSSRKFVFGVVFEVFNIIVFTDGINCRPNG